MSNLSRRAWLGMAGAAAVAGGMGMLPKAHGGAQASTMTPREAMRVRNFPNLELTTHEGEKVKFYDDLIKDKFVTINMIYTSCKATCPLTTANLVRVQSMLEDRVGKDLFMYSITIDPKRDTPKVLNKYVKTFGVGKGWKFLTGKPEDIEYLRRSLGFAWRDKTFDRPKDNHTGNLKYGNEPHMVWGAVPGMAKPEWVKECILFADWPKARDASQAASDLICTTRA